MRVVESELNDALDWLQGWGAGEATCETIKAAYPKSQKLVRVIRELDCASKEVEALDEAISRIEAAVPKLRDRDWTK